MADCMKTLAQVCSWLCLGLIALSLLLQLNRTPRPPGIAALFMALPFAATLAAFHFHPSRAFTAVATIANTLIILGFMLFAGEMLSIGGGAAVPQALLCLLASTPSIINLLAIRSASRTTQGT